MNEQRSLRWRAYVTGLVLLAELAHLAWEYFHGGVRSHHLLNRADLPAISNAWGALLLPLLAWFLTGRVQRRMVLRSGGTAAARAIPASIIAGFLVALSVGIALSTSFTMGNETVSSYIAQGIMALGVLLPIYRAECLLGFVLGMTFTFGAVLPTLVGSVFATASATVHLLVYPLLMRGWARLRHR